MEEKTQPDLNQKSAFIDHYVSVSVSYPKSIVVCTAAATNIHLTSSIESDKAQ